MARSLGVTLIRASDAGRVKEAGAGVASELGMRLMVGDGLEPWTPVYIEHFGQDPRAAQELSKEMSAEVVHLLLHDEDFAAYRYFSSGELVEEWAHPRDYFGDLADDEPAPPAGAIARFFDTEEGPEEFREWADSAPRRSAEVLLEDLARRLGAAGLLGAFEEIEEGILPQALESSSPELIEPVGAAELRRRERREVQANTRAYEEDGLLLEQISRPGKSAPIQSMPVVAATGDGFLLAWWVNGPPVTDKAFWLGGDPEASSDSLELSSTVHRLAVGGPDGNMLAVSHTRGDWGLELYDLQTAERLLDLPQPHLLTRLEFSPDGDRLFALLNDQLIILQLEGASLSAASVSSLELPARAVAMVSHPDARRLAVALEDALTVVDLERMEVTEPVELWSRDYDTWHRCVEAGAAESSFSPKEQAADLSSDRTGRRLAVATDQGVRVVEWQSLIEGRLEPVARALSAVVRVGDSNHRRACTCLFTPDDRSVLYAGLEGNIGRLDIEADNPTIQLVVPGSPPIIEMQASRDSRFLVTLCRPKMLERKPDPPLVQVWDYELLLRRQT